MPLKTDTAIEITAFRWVPEFAQGLVRDLRIRWALEEAGLDYRVRLLGQQRPPEYLQEQPFDHVPVLNEGDVHLFEHGAVIASTSPYYHVVGSIYVYDFTGAEPRLAGAHGGAGAYLYPARRARGSV